MGRLEEPPAVSPAAHFLRVIMMLRVDTALLQHVSPRVS